MAARQPPTARAKVGTKTSYLHRRTSGGGKTQSQAAVLIGASAATPTQRGHTKPDGYQEEPNLANARGHGSD
eukprot:scaffold10003_cov32-Tisochrysis_lutea.AAC.2